MMHGLQPQRPCQYVPFASALRPRIAWPTAHCKQRFGSASAAASSAADAGLAAEQNLLDNLFQDLCKHHGITSSVQLKHSDGGVGLFAAEPIAKGHTILRVPRSMCILIDNEAGSMTIPPGPWPRLSGGLMQQEPLTWDLLQALALMDATAGDGDPFWELYTDHFLPQPEHLTLPMCWSPQSLQELQHKAIIEAATQQQQRLLQLLPPEYMQPIGEGIPSYLQWGFACVRSRACQVGPQAFGMVPFVDLANHAADPNADVSAAAAAAVSVNTTGGSRDPDESNSSRNAAEGGGSSSSNNSMTTTATTQDFIDLVAVKDIAAGAEVTISYSGLAGYTNQRFMAQYGFVPSSGNRADRLELDIPTGLSSSGLRMSHLEEALGAGLMLEVARGNNPYIFAAMKSLPLTDDEVLPAGMAAAVTDGVQASSSTNSGSSNSHGRGTGPVTQEERAVAAALMDQVLSQLKYCGTTLMEDEELLQQLQQQQTDSSCLVQLAAAVRYRIERKKLLNACQVLLNVFIRS